MDNLADGDIVLFFSDHPVHLRQQRVTGCRWSNVALLLRQEDGIPALFEASRLSDCRDLRTGARIKGVQFSALIERVEPLVERLRLIKSSTEIDMIRRAAEDADFGVERLLAASCFGSCVATGFAETRTVTSRIIRESGKEFEPLTTKVIMAS